jgi:hypothetical protein
MSKTVIWVVLGILAVAGLSVVAVMQLSSRGEPAALAVPTPATPALAVPTTPPAASGSASTTAVGAPASGTPSDTGMAIAQPLAAIPSATPTIDDLIQSQSLYEGSPITLRGTILTQCTAGCEFALDDGTGVLSVQLEGKGKDRLIPLGKVGKKIEVHGVFRAAPRPQIVIEDPTGWQFVK